jgi:hypothetical protein
MDVQLCRAQAIWLQLQNYHVLPLSPRLDGCIDVERAINRGIPACPDLNRADFYDVELDDRWAYVHVRDDLKTVYLVAYFSSTPFNPSFDRIGSKNQS